MFLRGLVGLKFEASYIEDTAENAFTAERDAPEGIEQRDEPYVPADMQELVQKERVAFFRSQAVEVHDRDVDNRTEEEMVLRMAWHVPESDSWWRHAHGVGEFSAVSDEVGGSSLKILVEADGALYRAKQHACIRGDKRSCLRIVQHCRLSGGC